MMNETQAWALLEVNPRDGLDAAEKAWKRKVRALHPDLHPEDQRQALGVELASINVAWSALRALPATAREEASKPAHTTMAGKETGVFYSAHDEIVHEALENLAASDAKSARAAWFRALPKALMRGRLPTRMRPMLVVLCGAVVENCEGLSLLFEAPLPKGRAAVLVPTLRRGKDGVQVYPEKPRIVRFDTEDGIHGRTMPFSDAEVHALGVPRIDIVFPSRALDITKTVRIKLPEGPARLFYRT